MQIRAQSKLSASAFFTTLRFELRDNFRSRWLFFYLALLTGSALFLSYFGGSSEEGGASLINLVLLVTPLFALIFGALGFVESLPFLRFVIASNVPRNTLYLSKWTVVTLGLSLTLFVALLVATLGGNASFSIFILLFTLASLLQALNIAIAFLLAASIPRRETLMGVVLLLWLYLYFLHDFFILSLSILTNRYPLEPLLVAMIFLNPIDLVRIVFLIQTEASALFTYSTAFLVDIFGEKKGFLLCSLALLLWTAAPLFIGMRIFSRRDL